MFPPQDPPNPALYPSDDPTVTLETLQHRARHVADVRHRRRELRDLRRQQTAREALAGFHRGVEIYGLTKGQFSLIELLRATLEITGPAALVISTWTAAKSDILTFLELMRAGQLTAVRWLIDLSFQRRTPEFAHMIRQHFGPDPIRVGRIHAKFALFTGDHWRVVIRSSMNLNNNPRTEDFTIAHDPPLHDFLQEIIDEIWQKQPKDLAHRTPYAIEQFWQQHH